jgi:hypothetical protein
MGSAAPLFHFHAGLWSHLIGAIFYLNSMPVHEQKHCPRCNKLFECKVGDVTRCQCNNLKLGDEVQAFIGLKYQDCLCIDCLQTLQNKYNFFKERYFLK